MLSCIYTIYKNITCSNFYVGKNITLHDCLVKNKDSTDIKIFLLIDYKILSELVISIFNNTKENTWNSSIQKLTAKSHSLKNQKLSRRNTNKKEEKKIKDKKNEIKKDIIKKQRSKESIYMTIKQIQDKLKEIKLIICTTYINFVDLIVQIRSYLLLTCAKVVILTVFRVLTSENVY
ncbi:hypothetical protein RFI_40006 [Reticulomyxa filosa]|uniref:Uncharacterized protein n=1 Tax=Reticulomyxa filosa TaxID=46433 RepID=X6L812_RETFI|nr:hypothetical protein RFI_40006 [Reticulomyxa filosa]|eukprot:ETN97523.1 hypothetical protein RFI_40006 [Reticulomyxa filosa]